MAVGLLLSITLLWLAVRQTELAEIRAALRESDKIWAVPFIAVLFTFYWLKSHRWKIILSPIAELRSYELFRLVMIGYAGTAVLPMQLGEIVRVYLANKQFGIPSATLLTSIALERLLDFLMVVALLGVVLAASESVPDSLASAGYVIALGCLLALFCFALAVSRPESVMGLVRRSTARIPANIRDNLVTHASRAIEGLHILGDYRRLAQVIASSFIQWLLMGVCILFSLYALDLAVPVSAALLVLVATIIGISLPTGPGYVGNIQIAFVVALQPFDVSASDAMAASIYYHVLAYCAVIVVGFFYLYRFGYRFAQVARASGAQLDD